jgi:hypothetical protein
VPAASSAINALKRNIKKYSLLGVTEEAQAIKVAWSILDLGEFDEGGLQNNVEIKFKCWFADALQLHPHKVIRFDNTAQADEVRLYTFSHRVRRHQA